MGTTQINWLLLDPENPDVMCFSTKLASHEWAEMSIAAFIALALSPDMKRYLGFLPQLRTVDLWMVSLPPPPFAVVD